MGIDSTEKFKQALSFHQQGNLLQAKQAYEEIISMDPLHANSLHFLGVLCYQEKDLTRGVELITKAIAINPNSAGFYSNLGVVLMELQDYEQAAKNYKKALEIDLGNDNYHYNCGNALQKLERFEQSIPYYQKAISINPQNSDYYHNLGESYQKTKELSLAVENFQKAIAIHPNSESHLQCGAALSNLKQYDKAFHHYEKALELNPNSTDGHFLMATLLLSQFENFDLALHYLTKLSGIDPDHDRLQGMLLYNRNAICDWDNYDEQCRQIREKFAAGKKTILPFHALLAFDDPKFNYLVAKEYAATVFPKNDALGNIQPYAKGDKIRIAYYSADLHNHATVHLMLGIFERHDKSKFEITAFSFGPKTGDALQQKVMTLFDHFIDVGDISDKEVAQMSRDMKIDIAIDLKGFTHNTRLGIFAHRCAPIQVSYLGYPGTVANYLDYVIADKIVIPPCDQQYYQEKVLYMPHSYQCNDCHREIADIVFTKTQLGLPKDAFVFCCFNKSYKIAPTIFNSWMNILNAVPNSVLWLFETNESASKNLKKEAQKKGVDPSRIVFAGMMPPAQNLARQKYADLFLDTLPYNAHTTCSDALWGGLPVLTILGKSFASRVGASLLHAIGLPEMVVQSNAEYEAKAIELAQNPSMLQAIKEKLACNRLTTPLFDTQSFTTDLESLYQEIYDHYHSSSQHLKKAHYA